MVVHENFLKIHSEFDVQRMTKKIQKGDHDKPFTNQSELDILSSRCNSPCVALAMLLVLSRIEKLVISHKHWDTINTMDFSNRQYFPLIWFEFCKSKNYLHHSQTF